jgi:hypothetical protein
VSGSGRLCAPRTRAPRRRVPGCTSAVRGHVEPSDVTRAQTGSLRKPTDTYWVTA